MKIKKWLVVVCACLITVAAKADEFDDFLWVTTFGAERIEPYELYQHQRLRYRMWMDLCSQYRDIDCAGIPVPKIAKFRPNPLRPGLAGYYDGWDTVYIRSNLRGVDREDTIAHEMSHYFDAYTGITPIPGPARPLCFSEKRAWAVSDAVWIKHGYSPTGKHVVGSKWVNWYLHCIPYKDELYPNETAS